MVRTRNAPVKGSICLLVPDLGQYEPAVIPASHALRISDDLPLGFVEQFGAEWIVSCQASEFVEEVVRVHVMCPGGGHGLSHFRRVEVGKDLLDPTKFCQCVYSMGP